MAMERYIATDALVEILVRLPPSSLRLARLVCRRWRDAVNERTTEMQSRPRPLIWDGRAAYVVGDFSPESTGICRELRRPRSTDDDRPTQLVGTCNGLLLFCDYKEQAGGSLTVVNPATGETLPIPALPCAGRIVARNDSAGWHAAYSFGYHPTTGKYKVVHVPCIYGRLCEFVTVQVITLGETTWRDVLPLVGGARCNVAAGIISVDGMTHWVKVGGGGTRIVSFDLDTECFVSAATPLPRLSAKHDGYHLTEVHGRLGLVSFPEVWVLEQGTRRWSHRYKLEEAIPLPHFIYGDCILTKRNNSGFYGHWPKSSPRFQWCGVVHTGHRDHGTLVAKMTMGWTFAYVQTIEPLSVYATN